MKKLFLLLSLVSFSLSAMAQGGVMFGNDTLHLVYLSATPGKLLPGDAALAGQAYFNNVLSDGATLSADLFMGSSPSTLSRIDTTTFYGASTPGAWLRTPWQPPSGFPRGTTNYFQVQIRESEDASATASAALGHYFGSSSVFTSVVSANVAYYSIVDLTGPAHSTWAVGTFPMDSVLPGAEGAIEVMVPEPQTLVLGLLGFLGLFWQCRGKPS